MVGRMATGIFERRGFISARIDLLFGVKKRIESKNANQCRRTHQGCTWHEGENGRKRETISIIEYRLEKSAKSGGRMLPIF